MLTTLENSFIAPSRLNSVYYNLAKLTHKTTTDTYLYSKTIEEENKDLWTQNLTFASMEREIEMARDGYPGFLLYW